MNYVVFDLEWNQCPYGKDFENPRLPFEIIEIGAVKLDGQKEYVDSFHALIRPAVYKKLHFQTSRVIGITEDDLRKGRPFRQVVKEFISWCGEDARFCTWGTTDLTELQRNLRYYHMEDLLRGPILYEDVQKLFAIAFETRKVRRSLSRAVEFLELPEDGGFHIAKEDAAYTARVLQRIPDEVIRDNYSIDCYRNPKRREEEICLRYPDYEKFISREFATREGLLSSDAADVKCFTCGKKLRRRIRYFSDGSSHNYLAVGQCEEHGYVKCKLRVREAEDGRFYAIRTTKHISEEGVQEIRKKQAYYRQKRQMKRRK